MSAGMRRVCFALAVGVCIGLMPSLLNYMNLTDKEPVVRQVYLSEGEVASLYSRDNVQAASRAQSINKVV